MQGAPEFSLVVSEDDGTSVVSVKGELDIFTAPRLSNALAGLVDAGQDVVVALGETAFMESTGITGGYAAESTASNQRRIDLQLRFTF